MNSKIDKSVKLPEKEFLVRNSLLADLMKEKNTKAIYNFFIVMQIILFLNIFIGDLVAEDRINLGLSLIIIAFGKFHLALVIWCVMHTIISLLYYLLKIWAFGHQYLRESPQKQKIWNFTLLIGYIGYMVIFITATIRAVLYFNLTQASSVAVLLEMCRFLMKAHAFVRSNVPKVLCEKIKSDDAVRKLAKFLPSFTTFQYFMFCPTLVYRDSYPRTEKIRWKVAIFHFLDLLGVILYLSFIFERFLLPNFIKFGESQFDSKTLVPSIIGTMIPAIVALIIGFYGFFQSWLNGTAELCRFADRMFYQDWWNSTSYSMYYRKWNGVVHDWLYTYIYKDFIVNVTKGNKLIATFMVFMTSAIFHEIVVMFTFGFFYPVLLIFFAIFGIILRFFERKINGNLFFLLTLTIGYGLVTSFIIIENFARKNCNFEDTTRNFFYSHFMVMQ